MLLQGQISKEKWDEIVDCLSKWHQDDPNEQKAFRKANPKGYKFIASYKLVLANLPESQGGGVLHTLLRIGKNPRMVVPESEIFDCILEAHQGHGHLKSGVTWNAIRAKYHNITQAHVKKFISMCPTCNTQPPKTSTLKGAKKPIKSEDFRDRFQVDLIDMSAKPMKNLYGVTMRWILSVKDHFTGFAYLTSIPRKKPVFVAKELAHIFGIIGFPRILHTDNGNEFTAKVSPLV